MNRKSMGESMSNAIVDTHKYYRVQSYTQGFEALEPPYLLVIHP